MVPEEQEVIDDKEEGSSEVEDKPAVPNSKHWVKSCLEVLDCADGLYFNELACQCFFETSC